LKDRKKKERDSKNRHRGNPQRAIQAALPLPRKKIASNENQNVKLFSAGVWKLKWTRATETLPGIWGGGKRKHK